MSRTPHLTFWLSLLLAFCLQLVPLADAIETLRPLWIPMMLVYWALVEPRVHCFIAAFVMGIALDVHYNTVLGQHTGGLVILVYGMSRLRGILILFPIWQSTIALIPAWATYCLLMTLIDTLFRHSADPWLRWTPVLSSALFWPLVFSVMARLARHKAQE